MIVMACDKHDDNGGRSCNLLGDVEKRIASWLQHVHQLGTNKLCMKWLDVVGTTPPPIGFWCKWAWGPLQWAKIFQACVINKPFAWVLFQCHHLFYSNPKMWPILGSICERITNEKPSQTTFFSPTKVFQLNLNKPISLPKIILTLTLATTPLTIVSFQC